MGLSELPLSFTRRQAIAAGVSDVRLATMVRNGELIRVRRGVFTCVAEAASEGRARRHLDLVRAALDSRRGPHMVSHLSAVAAYGLPLPLGVYTVHLTALSPRARTTRRPGLWVHHANSYDNETCELDGLVLSSLARTVADCLRDFSPRVSVPIADAALHRRLVTREVLLAQMAMQCHWPGRTQADATTPLVDGRRESWLESYAFVRFAEWGISLPHPQVEVFDEAGHFVARTDGAWIEDATVLELDGRTKYQIPTNGMVDPDAVWEAEKARYDRLGNLGLERVRFGLTDLRRHEVQVRMAVRARRGCGSLTRFSGSFRIRSSSGLTLL